MLRRWKARRPCVNPSYSQKFQRVSSVRKKISAHCTSRFHPAGFSCSCRRNLHQIRQEASACGCANWRRGAAAQARKATNCQFKTRLISRCVHHPPRPRASKLHNERNDAAECIISFSILSAFCVRQRASEWVQESSEWADDIHPLSRCLVTRRLVVEWRPRLRPKYKKSQFRPLHYLPRPQYVTVTIKREHWSTSTKSKNR